MFNRYLSRAGPFIAVTFAAAGGLIFDAMTPDTISVTLFYVTVVLVGYSFPQPQAPLALLLLVVPLIIIGHWMTIPNQVPEWEAWFNRSLSIGTVSLVAVFVWYIRVLEQERKEHEERERLLVREMDHRVKNILSVVDAIAHRTRAESPEDFAKRFSERIRALSANQDLLFRNGWKGVDIKDLVRAQLSHFADLIGSRIVVHGPELRFNTAGAQAVGIAIHELATNAVKYGALSADVGHVNVCWRVADDTFTMNWTEREGPPVIPPERRGFGTTVTKAMAEHNLGGEVELHYAPSGVTWRLTCPAGNALEPGQQSWN